MDSLYVGIELAAGAIRVVTSSGQRITISGARAQDPVEWLELVVYGLAGVPPLLYAAVAVPVSMPPSERASIVRAGSAARFEGTFVCPSPYALARGVEKADGAVAVVVDPEASSVALVRGGAPTSADQDLVRPIRGREAREVAIAVRCLLKSHPRDVVRKLLRNVFVCGDETEIDRVGRLNLVRELEAIGALGAQVVGDSFAVAAGAERLAFELDQETWRRLSAAGVPASHRS